MECLGPQCAEILLGWLRERAAAPVPASAPAGKQPLLWAAAPYNEESPLIRDDREMAGAVEHLEYAVHRRYLNQVTRAERARLDNTIDNALFKLGRYAERLEGEKRREALARVETLRGEVRTGRERAERLRHQAKRADLKLSQLATLSPEGFEEFVGEVFESLGYTVEPVGGTGDEGADLRVELRGTRGVVQCKYHKKGVVGSPELQKFLGTIHHTASHKGFFVTTRTFSLAAEKFAADHPIELVDGPRLVELVQEAMGPGARREPEPTWF